MILVNIEIEKVASFHSFLSHFPMKKSEDEHKNYNW